MSPRGKPETLSRIAGTPQSPGRLEDSVLLLIDGQIEYVSGRLRLDGIEAAVGEGARLLALARERGTPVIHAIHHSRPGAPVFDPLGPHVAFMPELAPSSGETVLVKSLPNAFAGTDLADLIRRTGRRELIIAGFATHMCVSATARSALDHGFRSTIVAQATATRDLPDSLGEGVVPAAVVHAATLAALSDRFSVVIQHTGDLVKKVAP